MLAAVPHVDPVVLCSGEGDFRRLVEEIKARGVRVTVISTVKSQPPMVADELRREADSFIDLSDMATLIARPRRDSDSDDDYEVDED